jgi:D-alanyl-D-alanine endopeptidase (penicillin-binding protein 7)
VLVTVAVLVVVDPLPVAAASRAPTCRTTRRRVVKKRAVFLERRVPAFRNNLPNVQALGAVVVDLDSGQELYSRKPDQPRAIASISKLAAMLVVMDHGLPLDELTTMKKVDIEVARGGAPSRLPEGMTLSNRDLLHAALLGSDNRAVSALGRAAGLNATQLAEEMTRKAAQLGLKHTRFREPTGLSPENVSTPREVLAMLRAAMANPTLGPILRRVEYDAHPVARGAIHYVNTHRPAHRSNAEILGGKTGYNDVARYCLVLASRVDGHTYGMAFLGTEGKMTRFGDVGRATDWIVMHKPPAPAGAVLAGASGQPAPGGATEEAVTPLARTLQVSEGGADGGAPAAPALTPAAVVAAPTAAAPAAANAPASPAPPAGAGL